MYPFYSSTQDIKHESLKNCELESQSLSQHVHDINESPFLTHVTMANSKAGFPWLVVWRNPQILSLQNQAKWVTRGQLFIGKHGIWMSEGNAHAQVKESLILWDGNMGRNNQPNLDPVIGRNFSFICFHLFKHAHMKSQRLSILNLTIHIIMNV